MMQLKKTVVAVALGFGLSAFAQAYDGELSFSNPLNFSNEFPVGHMVGAGRFDWNLAYTFTLASDVSAADISVLFFANDYWDTNHPPVDGGSMLVSVYHSGYPWWDEEPALLTRFVVNSSAPDEAYTSATINFDSPASEYYYIRVSNWSNPGAAAWLTYNIVVTAAPIPEPETWVMLLAGLGIVGAVTRRQA